MVKGLPTMQVTQVQSLGWEDLLEKEMATHSSILAWRIPWTEEPGGLQSMGSQSQTPLSDFTFTFSLQRKEPKLERLSDLPKVTPKGRNQNQLAWLHSLNS